jgi:hypothetical protein
MRRLILIAAAISALSACQQPAPAPKVEAPKVEAQKAEALTLPVGAFTVTGLVTRMVDAGYPMFHVTVTPASGPPVQMLWMAEDQDVKVSPQNAEPEDFKGKQVEVTYARTATADLFDISIGGKGLVRREPGEAAIPEPGAKSITGLLAGPKVQTAGDLPDELTVTDAAGQKITVQHFIIEDEIVKAVGKTVTLTYYDGQDTDLTGIRLLPTPAKK